jgi:hypothetical protein
MSRQGLLGGQLNAKFASWMIAINMQTNQILLCIDLIQPPGELIGIHRMQHVVSVSNRHESVIVNICRLFVFDIIERIVSRKTIFINQTRFAGAQVSLGNMASQRLLLLTLTIVSRLPGKRRLSRKE